MNCLVLARSYATVATMTLAAVVAAGTVSRAAQDVVFSSTAELVRVHVAVFDEHGPVLDLKRERFSVLEDGAKRPLSVFLGPEDGPLDVAIAMDTSESMSTWSSRSVFHELLDGLDNRSCVLVLPFGEEVGQGLWGHPDDPAVRSLIDDVPQTGRLEAAYDALVVAFGLLRGRSALHPEADIDVPGFLDLMRFRDPSTTSVSYPPTAGACWPTLDRDGPRRSASATRRAVVIVTDQPDSASASRLEDVLLASWGSGIPVFALATTSLPPLGVDHALNATAHRDRSTDVAGPMETLARHTGGLVFHGTKGRYDRQLGRHVYRMLRGTISAAAAAKRLGRALNGHYLLGYAPGRDADADEEVVSRVEVTVHVAGDGLEVLTVADLVRGRGSSEVAALDRALTGFRELGRARTEEAVQSFEAALRLAPELGVAHYGLGLGLAQSGRQAESLAAFRDAETRAPWLPDLDARLAQAELETGGLDRAWEHALRAHYRGSDVESLLARLQRLAPRSVDLDKPPVNPRVVVETSVRGGLPALLVAPRLIAAVHNMVAASDVVQGGWSRDAADLRLTVGIDHAAATGPWVHVRGRLILEDRAGKNLASQAFRVHDGQNGSAVAAALESPFADLERAVLAVHR